MHSHEINEFKHFHAILCKVQSSLKLALPVTYRYPGSTNQISVFFILKKIDRLFRFSKKCCCLRWPGLLSPCTAILCIFLPALYVCVDSCFLHALIFRVWRFPCVAICFFTLAITKLVLQYFCLLHICMLHSFLICLVHNFLYA